MTDSLLAGYQRFRNGYYRKKRKQLEKLAQKQSPQTAMISCCDSRVDPGILFDTDPGEIFTIRNVANLVPPCESAGDYHGTSAALEFAVNCLKVRQIVVLGHASCGGIQALMKNDSSIHGGSFINNWMQIAMPAKKHVLESLAGQPLQAQTRACEQMAIRHSLQNLLTYPWIAERVAEGSLRLIGWYYDLNNGELFDVQANRRIELEPLEMTTGTS